MPVHGQRSKSVNASHNNWIITVIFSPDGTRIVSGSEDITIRIWDTMSGHDNPSSATRA
jgi:WD40 repeat protein